MNWLSLHQLSLFLGRTQVGKRIIKILQMLVILKFLFSFKFLFIFYQKVQVEVQTKPSLDPESALAFKKYMH